MYFSLSLKSSFYSLFPSFPSYAPCSSSQAYNFSSFANYTCPILLLLYIFPIFLPLLLPTYTFLSYLSLFLFPILLFFLSLPTFCYPNTSPVFHPSLSLFLSLPGLRGTVLPTSTLGLPRQVPRQPLHEKDAAVLLPSLPVHHRQQRRW